MNPALKRTLNWAGSGLALLGTLFVGQRLWHYGSQLDPARFGPAAWLGMAAAALAYGAANLLLAFGWAQLLACFHQRCRPRWVVGIYGVTQLAKYLPGNIFHFAGRQALGMAAGLPGGALAKSTLWELALLCAGGVLCGLLALPLLLPWLPPAAAALLALAAWFMASVLLRRITPPERAPLLCTALLYYSLFLLIAGLLFCAVLAGTIVPAPAPLLPLLPSLCGAYVLAWLAGLVTPGAPAGVGIREMVLIFLLKGVVADPDVVMAVLAGRLITVAGDVLFFVVTGLFCSPRRIRPA
ncbi:hypothetical protein P0E69_13375 [Chimaeribacter arupi]|uniref:hypothetical protein n=1 Tax=Chimaeribacter arupi TaxID=2060066 RepID=UPI002711F517|nr:hypothetical protein [Chimaeribacter arupi]WKZ91218.1 hypothetical protein P0E69_13375 [Chimaeribacter arupi]